MPAVLRFIARATAHISKQLAERRGGRLWLDASSTGGSVFAFDLPAAVDRTALRSRSAVWRIGTDRGTTCPAP